MSIIIPTTEEVDAVQNETLKGWKPHDVQEDFITLPTTIREGLYGGAAGSGKTDVLLMIPIILKLHEHPEFKGLILRRTLPELEQEIVPRSEKYYRPFGAVYNVQSKTWKFPSGGRMRFGHAEHEKDIAKYDGGQLSYVGFDELTHFLETQYLYLVGSRLRSPAPGVLPAIARSATNPGNVGHEWVYRRFVKPCETGRVILVDKKNKNNKRIFIPAKLDDNPHIDPAYADALDLLSESERKAKKDGNWHSFEGQVFSFRPNGPLRGEPENANHVIPAFEIPAWWPKVATIDWGYAAKTAIHWGAISPEGQVFVYRERIYKGKEISEWATEFKEISKDDNLRSVHIDPSAKKNYGSETIYDQFIRHSGYSSIIDVADNDRISGKLLLQEHLRWWSKPLPKSVVGTYSPELAQQILRMYGEDEYRKYMGMFKAPEPEGFLPKLQIFSECTDLIETIPLCVYAKNNKEDVAEFNGDDSYDNIRYLLKCVLRYLNLAARSGTEEEQLEKARRKLAESNDQTAFYRIAEKLEAGKRKSFGVRMFRRRGRR